MVERVVCVRKEEYASVVIEQLEVVVIVVVVVVHLFCSQT